MYSNSTSNQDYTKFDNLIKLYELNPNVANQLREVLSSCEVVLICDDSSSMCRPVVEIGADPFAMNPVTRWSELKKLAGEVIKFVTSVNPTGLDIYFLNRGVLRGVTDITGLQTVFARLPEGATPMISTLKSVYDDKKHCLNGKKLLIVVVTDGEPTDKDQYDYSNTELFGLLTLMTSGGDIHISVAETTDDPGSMDFLDNWTGKIKNFDNTDDYREELARVRMTMGQNFKFDYTDYVIKILLATFIRWYFNLDQNNNLNRVGQFQNNNNNNYVVQKGNNVYNYRNFQNDFPDLSQINQGSGNNNMNNNMNNNNNNINQVFVDSNSAPLNLCANMNSNNNNSTNNVNNNYQYNNTQSMINNQYNNIQDNNANNNNDGKYVPPNNEKPKQIQNNYGTNIQFNNNNNNTNFNKNDKTRAKVGGGKEDGCCNIY